MGQPIQQSDIYALITNQIIQRLEEGVIPWRQPWTDTGLPQNLLTKRHYKGINVWLLCSLGFERNLFLTFKQIQGLDARVKKGAKSVPVIFWKRLEKEDSETKEVKYISFLRYYSVFNVEQCDGIPKDIIPSIEVRENDPIELCDNVYLGMPEPPKLHHAGNEAYYDKILDFINMPLQNLFDDSVSYYATLFHELVHSTGHSKRLNRKEIAEPHAFGSEGYSMEELVAELGACYLKSYTGIASEIDNNVAYIDYWLKVLKNDKQLIIHAGAKAQRAVDYILNVSQPITEKEEEPLLKESVS